MATFEDINLALNTIQNIEGLRKDIRANATAYKADIQSGRSDSVKLAEIMKADANEYMKRLLWQQDIFASVDKKSKLTAGLLSLGATIDEAVLLVQEMTDSANATISSNLKSPASIRSRSDSILTEIVQHDMVW